MRGPAEGGGDAFHHCRDVVLHVFADCIVLAQRATSFRACGRVRRARQTYLAHVPLDALLAAELAPDNGSFTDFLIQLRWARTRVLLRAHTAIARRLVIDAITKAIAVPHE